MDSPLTDDIVSCPISGSVRWASKERQIFRQNFRTKGKEFAELKKDVSLTWGNHTSVL